MTSSSSDGACGGNRMMTKDVVAGSREVYRPYQDNKVNDDRSTRSLGGIEMKFVAGKTNRIGRDMLYVFAA